jgi:hypothetical protein
MPPTIPIATPELARLVDLPHAPGTVDDLTDEDCRPEAQPPISLRRDCLGISKWAQEYDGKPVVVVCQKRRLLHYCGKGKAQQPVRPPSQDLAARAARKS